MVIPPEHEAILKGARLCIVHHLNLEDDFILALEVAGLYKPAARRIRETKENKNTTRASEELIEELDNGRLSLSAFYTCLDATKQHALQDKISQEASKVGLSKSDLLDQELLQKLKGNQDLQKSPSRDVKTHPATHKDLLKKMKGVLFNDLDLDTDVTFLIHLEVNGVINKMQKQSIQNQSINPWERIEELINILECSDEYVLQHLYSALKKSNQKGLMEIMKHYAEELGIPRESFSPTSVRST